MDYSLSGPRSDAGILRFHLVLLPTTQFLAGEKFSMKALVPWIAASECRSVNLLPYPPLPILNWGGAVGTFCAIADHFLTSR
jgi:hypothetical protein